MSAFIDFLRLVASGDAAEIVRRLAADPSLARTSAAVGASRANSTAYFLDEIEHYVYAGDTALHVAAAAFHQPTAELLIAKGADVAARNRRGAQPLHYAADANRSEPDAQAAVIRCLVTAGADPNARDKSGVTPLHRAVRTRSAAAVAALLDAGAHVNAPNGSGSTPLDLARLTTGRGGSGTSHAREQQARIIELLKEKGARAGRASRPRSR